ncbi:MAG: hypothetical protein AB7F96_10195 [Beijerinckiaceae bacterium]
MNAFSRFAASAALAACAFAAVQPAQAITVRNCTGDVIRVNIYNNDDALRVIPKAGGKIGPGAVAGGNTGAPRAFVKVFKGGVVDQFRTERGGLADSGYFSVTRNYQIVPGNACN